MAKKLYTDKRYNNRVELDRFENGRAFFFSQGGGFQHSVTIKEWDANFRVAKKPVFAKAKVTGEWLDDGVKVECYSNGNVWNGWAMPYFTKKQADAYMKLQNAADLVPTMRYDAKQDAYIVGEGEEMETYVMECIMVPCRGGEKQIEVYGIGSGGWTWEAA